MGCGPSNAASDARYETHTKPEPEAPTATAPKSKEEEAAEVAPNEPEPILEGERLSKVQNIFTQWDLSGDGKLELTEFVGASVKVGPMESKVLKTLGDMDFNGDGFVVLEEWVRYFAMTSSMLSDAEFEAVIADLTDAGNDLITTLQCTKIAMGAQAASAPAETAEEQEEEEAASEPSPLSTEQRAAVEEIFAAWDVGSTGAIAIAKVQETKLDFGPNQSKVFEYLGMMDADGDGLLTLDEMLGYFTVLADGMPPEQFEFVRSELLGFAQSATLIDTLTMLAAEPTPAGRNRADTEIPDEEDPVPELTEERTKLLQSLFDGFKQDGKATIVIAEVQDDSKIEIGPNTFTPLEFMAAMDENSDGEVTFDEMCSYFKAVGAALTDEEFALILDEMIDAVSTKKMLKAAQAS